MTQFLLALLMLAVVLGAINISEQISKLRKSLEGLANLLSTQFSKEGNYYKEKEESDRIFEEWKEKTHGLGPIDAIPPCPRPPPLVSIGEDLRLITSLLGRIVAAAENPAATKKTSSPPSNIK